jgi:hypothetical protein
MDISTITDVNQLKAMAYDQIASKEQAQRNLDAINQRIGEVMTADAEAANATPAPADVPAENTEATPASS